VAPTTTSSTATALAARGIQQIYNKGATNAFVTFGTSTVVATLANGTPYPSGAVGKLNAENNTYVAAICSTAAGTATVYITAGEGF